MNDRTGTDPEAAAALTGKQIERFTRELRGLRAAERSSLLEAAAAENSIKQLLEQNILTIKELKVAYFQEKARRAELEGAYLSTVRMLASAIEVRDGYTGGHILRVAKYSKAIGAQMALSVQSLTDLEFAATLHDLGKIGIPDAILGGTRALNDAEQTLMRQHPAIGAALLREVPALERLADIVIAHHERWDGYGYPSGLKEEAIPLLSRIVSVADALDAITTARSYRQAEGLPEAMAEITRSAGTSFDPQVVSALAACFERGDFELE